MSESVLRITASDGDAGSEYHRLLHQAFGYAVAQIKSAGIPFPFGRQITHLTEEKGTLIVRMDTVATAFRYGGYLIEAWQTFGQSAIEFRFEDGAASIVLRKDAPIAVPGRGAALLSFKN